MNTSVYDFRAKFYEEDGSYIDTDRFQITISVSEDDGDPESILELADSLAGDKADEMMETYDAHSYEMTLEDAG